MKLKNCNPDLYWPFNFLAFGHDDWWYSVCVFVCNKTIPHILITAPVHAEWSITTQTFTTRNTVPVFRRQFLTLNCWVENDERGGILAGGGYSVTALTPPAALEKGTAFANSHWICTNFFNFQFLAKYNIIFLVTYWSKVQICDWWALWLYLEEIVWFHEDSD